MKTTKSKDQNARKALPGPSSAGRFSPGVVVMTGIAALAVAPLLAIFVGAIAAGGGETQSHLLSVTGLRYLSNTLALCLLAGIGASVIGAGTAILISLTEFPGRRFFGAALALPFAIPAYVAAYTYGDLFGPFGAVARMIGPAGLPEIRSLPGAAFILMLMTYPYVYLAMNASLSSRSSALIEAARALGATSRHAVFDILLRVSRPAFFGGIALALMEIVADYGVADYFGVPTLSVGIFRTWYGLGDLPAAIQLSAGLFLVALLLILLESASRRGRSAEDVKAHRTSRRLKLSPLHASAAITACTLPVLFGFIAPVSVLLAKLGPTLSARTINSLTQAGTNTAIVAIIGAASATFAAILLAYAARRARGRLSWLFLRIATLGYAVPGAVMAIGILGLTAALSRWTGLALAGGVGVLLYAYVARFLTAGFNAVSGGLEQISPQMDLAARSLGAGSSHLVTRIHWPLARTSILAGAAIVAVDIAKELPATLILRPFNFETLSTQVYRLASDERLADAAPAALTLIALGLLPTLLLSLLADRSDKKRPQEHRYSCGRTHLIVWVLSYSPPR